MASNFTGIVAAKKLAAIKKSYKINVDEDEEVSPETRRKLEEKIAKDQRKREKQEEKREEKYEERSRQREKLRNRIKEKYQIGTSNVDGEEEQKTKKKNSSKKKKDLREKDFYKYNKAMPEEKGKKVAKDGGTAGSFAQATAKLNDETEEKEKKKEDCVIC